jgi:hypothetical protein
MNNVECDKTHKKYQFIKKVGLLFTEIFTKNLTSENLNNIMVIIYILSIGI